MNRKHISETIDNINPKYINEATAYTGAAEKETRRTGWMKWAAIAACFFLVVFLGIGFLHGGLFGGRRHTATLDNGDTINFVRSGSGVEASDIAFYIETRDLTKDEIEMLFDDLPVTAYALFDAENHRILGIEGKVDGMKLIVSVPGVTLVDAVIDGEEHNSYVDGVPVNAGYTVNGKNIIYYATFPLGESTVYIEHTGAKGEREYVKNDISAMIQSLIALRELNLKQISK